MSVETTLQDRSGNRCELCGGTDALMAETVAPRSGESADDCVLLCARCREDLHQDGGLDAHHWRCLSDSMWTPVPAVQVMAWRILDRLAQAGEGWAVDLRDSLYLEPEIQAWATQGSSADDDSRKPTLDSNGNPLQDGDTVTLIKDLPVKGAGFTAKRGTAVRNISLTDNPEQIEGRVNGVRIVLLTQYLKKA
jgi:protein PhnA